LALFTVASDLQVCPTPEADVDSRTWHITYDEAGR
jgi:hypothetical protein